MLLLKTILATVFHHSLEQLEMHPSMQSPSTCDEMYNKEHQTAENEMCIISAVAGFY